MTRIMSSYIRQCSCLSQNVKALEAAVNSPSQWQQTIRIPLLVDNKYNCGHFTAKRSPQSKSLAECISGFVDGTGGSVLDF